jgi:type VI secretion system protein VasJ
MIDFAKALRSADPWDPRAFALVRTAGQLLIAAMPDVADGRLDVPPPNPDDAAALAAFAARGDREKGIAMGEDFIVAAPFWLDAHRMVAEMIGDQGPPAAPARAVAEKAAMALCGRFEGLEHLAFQDGTPTADETTRAWLAGLGGPGGGAPPPPEEAALEDARQLARQGEVGRGAALLAQGPGGEGGRARALWQIARARFCLDVGRPHGAVAILEALEAELAEPSIAAYDPRLRVEVLSLLVRAIERIPAPADDAAREAELERLRKMLYSLDLPTAIGLLQP